MDQVSVEQLSRGTVSERVDDMFLSPKLHSLLLKKASIHADFVLEQVADRFGMLSASVVRYVLQETNTIIGGSTPLLALHPSLDFPLQNVDLYTPWLPRGQQDWALCGFVESCGYELVDAPEEDEEIPYVQPSVVGVQHYMKHAAAGVLSVHIFYVRGLSPIAAVVESHSTLIMNYIAWYGVVSLYPDLTLRKVGVAVEARECAVECFDKYKDRGFAYVHPSAQSLYGVRCLHGEGVLFVPFLEFDSFCRCLGDFDMDFRWTIPPGIIPTRIKHLLNSNANDPTTAVAILKATGFAYIELDEQFKRFGLGSADVVFTVLMETKTLLSGSAVLAALHPNTFEPGDLDFYTRSDGCGPFSSFLEMCGFELSRLDENDGALYDLTTIHSVSKYCRVVDAVPVSINVISVPPDVSPIQAIVEFHSTLVMSFVSWYGLVCLYPRLTLQKRGLVLQDTERTRKCFMKYRKRGFCIGEEQVDDTTLDVQRNLFDDDVLFLPFVSGGPQAFYPLENVQSPFLWKLKRVTDRECPEDKPSGAEL
ncbi:hypothetical protein CPC08DRAFT_761079 [Agrocybe pediades]|nr:hypothetical protein CPC08DRAFT_761079 [Agrocybe pediades]